MDSGLYAACTALMARTDALDTIANNLANSSTGGFRARHTTFSSVLAGSGRPLASQLNEATNSYGLLGGSHLDMQQGSLARTGSDLDVGIDGPGFLTVKTASGNAYTRNGSLQVSTQGQLITATGEPVLGENGPITIPRNSSVTISADGTISANGAIAGKLKLVEFSATADPQSMGSSYYTVPDKDVVAASKSEVRQGMLEGSNVNPVASVIELINAQRAAEGMRHAMTMIDTEIDKTAAQDLPRVS
ncbi:flagellar basal-body rod protein FlgF [Granulicella tundricola]|uniref:Flagellar basal-body rod protein FlgF n=1 Tax=Granulicella tundricola (strain ATCC BAA-1859 / DSM 23138 / MP5ACTX9) TaxID=1198114 RepID=E8X623_GRATM|nr:flagellar basal-body rod protein FlgF [Granulicella tundricola]ADW70907.1 flagellar basal-body rod protein FlgF [Granulicella tundricola MP5ACTX9]